jgi:hypothetical protein
MCARTVRMQRKPNSVAKFNQTLANDILPLLRAQPGFQDEMTFVVPGGMEVVGIGLWEQQEHAEAYALRHTYLAVLRALAHVMEGRPQAYPYTLRTRPSTQVLLASQPDTKRVLVGGGAATAALSLVWCVIAITY